ncbi:MAG: hypothetical protein ABSE48_20920 [Verrucomicrobiota bacterium]|jgi:hypothetical protein
MRTKGKLMKIAVLTGFLAIPVLLTSCATPPPPQAFHKVDNTALVIDSLDNNTCQVIQPALLEKQKNDQVLTEAHKLTEHKTAVVILENYKEMQPGSEFRDRATPLFVGLRGAGYRHIVFLQGKGVNDPEGLITLANYE